MSDAFDLPRPLPSLDALVATLERSAGADDGDPIDLLSHALQCAAILRDEHPDDRELQVAGLVHDLGWLSPPSDDPRASPVVLDARHDRVGARLVEQVLGPRVANLVANHVRAKRYLVATDTSYAARLSARSVETLGFQGGAMTEAEIAEFAALADLDAVLALRRADDRAKVVGADVPGLDVWLPTLRHHAAVQAIERRKVGSLGGGDAAVDGDDGAGEVGAGA